MENVMLAITAPTGAELLVTLAMALAFVAVVGGTIWFVVRLARRDGPDGSPTGQQPPPGYWWDGQKWNPPGERAE